MDQFGLEASYSRSSAGLAARNGRSVPQHLGAQAGDAGPVQLLQGASTLQKFLALARWLQLLATR